jgi:hypothetical protein
VLCLLVASADLGLEVSRAGRSFDEELDLEDGRRSLHAAKADGPARTGPPASR